MTKLPNNSLPKYLEDLLLPTALGSTKLIAVWDSLSAETQIQILSSITDEQSEYPQKLLNKIRLKALVSSHVYIKHIALKGFMFDEEFDRENKDAIKINEIIKNDHGVLIKYYGENLDWLSSSDSESFFELPHQARLMSICNSEFLDGSEFSKLITYGVKNNFNKGDLTEEELYELVIEFTNHPKVKDMFVSSNPLDGHMEYLYGKDLEAMWELVLKVPESASYPLIKFLPEKCGFCTEIPKGVLNELNKRQIETLLRRKDIELLGLRKNIFNEAIKENLSDPKNSRLLSAAISNNFNLSFKEFAEVLKKTNEDKIKIISELGMYCKTLNLCILRACSNFISSLDYGKYREWENRHWIEENISYLEKQLDWREREIQNIELCLYGIAVDTTPESGGEGYLPSVNWNDEKLKIFDDLVVEGDAWATFMAFSDAWRNLNDSERKDLKKSIPGFRDVDKEDEEEPIEKSREEEKFLEKISLLENQIFDLRKNQGRFKKYLIIIIILLIIILIK